MADVKHVDNEPRYPQADYSDDVRRLVVRLTELHRQYVQKLVELEKRIKALEP
jgi:hypothetical protein